MSDDTAKSRKARADVPTSDPPDEPRRTDGYVVALPTFEGPLDLLLHLIQKHELEILDIPVSFITEKYLEYINLMQNLSIDLASEYLVMAATLAYIKSRTLLPPENLGPEDELLRADMVPGPGKRGQVLAVDGLRERPRGNDEAGRDR